jgi:glutamate racemase
MNQTHNDQPIGIFDSGVGGLTVCKEIRDLLPQEDLIYFGDTMRFPYGTRSIDTVIRYAREITEYFRTRNVKMIVCACNTASAAALPTLIAENSLPVVGVVQAGARAACRLVSTGKIGVIATRATIKSEAYIRAIHGMCSDVEVLQQHATLFVSLVEEGLFDSNIARLCVKEYLNDFYNKQVRTVILGCTHFPLMKKVILETYPDMTLIDTGREIALEVRAILKQKNLANKKTTGTIELYASDITDTIYRLKEFFFGANGTKLEQFIISEKI